MSVTSKIYDFSFINHEVMNENCKKEFDKMLKERLIIIMM